MNIRCGNCGHKHATIEAVRMCHLDYDEAVEVCCGICDALKGYAHNDAELERLNRTGCGCDGMSGQVRPRTWEEFKSQTKDMECSKGANIGRCKCPSEYSMCKWRIIWYAEQGLLDGTKYGTNGGKGHGGWSGYGNQLENA